MLVEQLVIHLREILASLIGGLVATYIVKRRFSWKTLVPAIAFYILAVLLAVIVFPPPRLVTVPYVIDLDKDLAVDVCEQSNLKPKVGNYAWSADIKADKVLEQHPSPGALVHRNSEVTLRISLGPPVAK